MTDESQSSATYEVHGIDEEPTLTWTSAPDRAANEPAETEDDGPAAA